MEYNLTSDNFEGSDGNIPNCYITSFTKSYTRAYERMLEDVLPPYRELFEKCFRRENILNSKSENRNCETKEFLVNYKNQPIWVRVFYQVMKDPYTSDTNIWITCININEEKQSELKLIEMAKIDKVTGVYNRGAFIDLLEDKCNKINSRINRFLIMIDIDNFGKINDVFGHDYGDRILKEIAKTLKLITSSDAIIARIGGDEFTIYTGEIEDITLAKERLRIIIASMYKELNWGIKLTISAGVSMFPNDGDDFEVLYKKADIALHNAKLMGGNKYVIYEDTMNYIEKSSIDLSTEVNIVNKGIYIRTFGFFEIFVNGKVLLIQNAKAKELLAVLVDRRGSYASQADIIACLWEDETVNKVTLARVRKIVMYLRNTLKEYGIEEIIESKKGSRRLNTDIVNCDLYNYLSGKNEYSNLYKGSYMLNYSWGELTMYELETQHKKYMEKFMLKDKF